MSLGELGGPHHWLYSKSHHTPVPWARNYGKSEPAPHPHTEDTRFMRKGLHRSFSVSDPGCCVVEMQQGLMLTKPCPVSPSPPVLCASSSPAHDAQPNARVPQRALHLRVCVPPAFPLHALGQVNPCLSGSGVSGLSLCMCSWARVVPLGMASKVSECPSSLFLWSRSSDADILTKYHQWTASQGPWLPRLTRSSDLLSGHLHVPRTGW